MAGQTTLDTKYYPSDFTVTTSAPIVLAAATATTVALLYADRPILIDSVNMWLAGGVGIAGGGLDVKIKWVAAAASPTWATTSQDVGSFATIPGNATPIVTTQQTMALALTKTNGTPSNNVIPANSWVWIQTNQVSGTITNTPTVVVQIRFRSQF
jgi:hypothetical protein